MEPLSWRIPSSEEPMLSGGTYGTLAHGSFPWPPFFLSVPFYSLLTAASRVFFQSIRQTYLLPLRLPLTCSFKPSLLSLSYKTSTIGPFQPLRPQPLWMTHHPQICFVFCWCCTFAQAVLFQECLCSLLSFLYMPIKGTYPNRHISNATFSKKSQIHLDGICLSFSLTLLHNSNCLCKST